MVKIQLEQKMNSWYMKEIGKFFKRNQTYSYKQASKMVKKSLGISFKKLLVSSPHTLIAIAKDIKNSKPKKFDTDRKIFIDMYEKFRSSVSSKNFIEKVNLKVCPYCNRNYIFNFKKKNKHEATAQLDHFIDKGKYPYFALCLYNLVPSCGICNQRKSAKDILDKPIYNPYSDNIHNHIKFSASEISPSDKLDFFDEKRINITIEAKTEDSKINEHLKTFNIEELYNNHKDIIAELYHKRVIYSDGYIDELIETFGKDVFESRDDLLRLITCGYVDDDSLNMRPMSKLIKDISEELGFI